MSAYMNVRLHECLLIRMSAYTNVCLYECLLIQMSANMNVRLYECPLIRMSTYMNVRLYDYHPRRCYKNATVMNKSGRKLSSNFEMLVTCKAAKKVLLNIF